jgi:hypothetical protein
LRDEVLLKAVLLGLDDPGLLRTILEDYRDRVRTQLEEFDERALNPAACESRSELLLTFADLLGCFRQQAELRWVERCLEEIHRLDDLPPLNSPPGDLLPTRNPPALRFTPSDPPARRSDRASIASSPSSRDHPLPGRSGSAPVATGERRSRDIARR